MKNIAPVTLMMIGCGLAASARAQTPLGTAFTYQGQLKQSGSPASGNFTMVFKLFDASGAGNQVGPTLTFDGAGGNPPQVAVASGLFTVQLDFGSVFAGNKRWLEITVSGTMLSPRQELTAAPHALFALNAATATNATQLNGQTGSFFQNASNLSSGTLGDARLSANVALLNAVQTFTGAQTFSTAPSFAAAGSPFSVSNSTLVTNLNADLLDGLNSSSFLQSIPIPLSLSGTAGQNAAIIHGENASTSGLGVRGLATAAIGQTVGVYGESRGSLGTGVWGQVIDPSGQTTGVYGATNSTAGTGISGFAGAFSGATFGVSGQSNSTGGTGVFGVATANSGTAEKDEQIARQQQRIAALETRFERLEKTLAGLSGSNGRDHQNSIDGDMR